MWPIQSSRRDFSTTPGWSTSTCDTAELIKMMRDGQLSAELARLPNVVMLAGGLVVQSGGSVLGGVGVAGAPGGEKDEACARAGLKAVQDKLDF